jgi:hypothetical protein
MDTDFLKKYLRFKGAIINDKAFNSNTKLKNQRLPHPTRQEVSVGDDIHPQFKPSWEYLNKKEEIEPDQETLKGKALLSRVYQGGAKVSASQILDKITKTDSAIIKHLEGHIKRGDADEEDYTQTRLLKKHINEIQYTPANKIPKSDEIWKWSNPKTAQKNATKYYKKDIYRSNRKDKKYMIQDDDGKWVHFGGMLYQDFTKHADQSRRENYLKRASKIKGDWKGNPFSANALAMRILW